MMQKRGAYNLKNFLMTILMIAVFVFGSWAVFASHRVTVSIAAYNISPAVVKANRNATYNISVTNDKSTTLISSVKIKDPKGFSNLSCEGSSGSWDCAAVGSYLEFSNDELEEGELNYFTVHSKANATPSSNATWEILTNDGVESNTTYFNTSVDADTPKGQVLNASTGTGNNTLLQLDLQFDGTYYLNGSDIIIYAHINDTNTTDFITNVSLYYTINSTGDTPTLDDTSGYNETGPKKMRLLSGNNETSGVWNATISGYKNGDVVNFVILANDSVGNFVVLNNSNSGYNFTIDAIPPNVSDIILIESFGADDDFINSTASYVINVSVNEGLGNVSNIKSPVQIKCDSGGTYNDLTIPDYGTTWNTSISIETLGCASDGVHTLTIKAYDNVSNKNESETIKVTVDDDAPKVFNMNSNTSYNFTKNNATEINISLSVSDYINPSINLTIRNASVPFNGSTNMTQTGNDNINGTSNWQIIQNLTQFGCPGSTSSTGAIACTLWFNATDLGGRFNSSETITIWIDSTAPIIGAGDNKSTTNQTDEAANVYNSSDLFNISIITIDNIVSVIAFNNTNNAPGNPLSLVNYSDQGIDDIWVNKTANATDIGCTADMGECGINFNITDKAGNVNETSTSSEILYITIDDSAPHVDYITTNITILENRTRSDVTINISVNASDRLTNITEVTITVDGNTLNLSNVTLGRLNWNTTRTPVELGCNPGENNCSINFTARDLVRNKNASESMILVIDDRAPRIMNFSVNVSSVGSTTEHINITLVIEDPNLNSVTNVSVNNTNELRNLTKGGQYGTDGDAYYWFIVTNTTALGCTEDGDCIISVNATDDVGNINISDSSESITIQIDTIYPNVTGVNVAPNPVNAMLQYLTVTAKAQDESSVNGSRAYIDGHTNYAYLSGTYSGTDVNVTGSFDLSSACGGSACGEGVHTVYVQANDSTGRWSDANAAGSYITFTVNNSLKPTVKATLHPTANSYTNYTTPMYNISVNISASQCEFTEYVNGNKNSSVETVSTTNDGTNSYCKFTFSTLADGDLAQPWVRVREAGGLWSNIEPLPTWTIDITKPTVNITTPLPNNVTTSLTPTLTFSVEEEAGGTLLNLSTLNVTDSVDEDVGFTSGYCTASGDTAKDGSDTYARIYSCSFTSSALTDDSKHVLSIVGRDRANNIVNFTRTHIVNTTVAINATLVASDTTGTADSTYANGWSFTFNISTGTGVNATRFRMDDWTKTGATDTIKIDGNVKMTYTDNNSDTQTYQVHNTYNDTAGVEEVVYALRDDSAKSGKQSQVVIAVKIPTGTTVGSYTTSYAFGAYTINASGAA